MATLTLTADEAKRIRLALIWGRPFDPQDPKLEAVIERIKKIEKAG